MGVAVENLGLAIERVKGFDDRSRLFAREGIIDGLGLAAGVDQVVAAQPGQVLGHGRLAEADEALQLADAFLLPQELAKDKRQRRNIRFPIQFFSIRRTWK